MKSMAAMKAMKAMRKSGSMSASGAYAAVALKAAVEAFMAVGVTELKKNGSFKVAGMLNLKLKTRPARPARKGVNPFTKEPCVFKAKPASKTVRALALKKLKDIIN